MVPRRRILQLLAAEPRAPVVSVVAPAGYGKTLLLADWVSREPGGVAWLTIDDYDNDATVLVTYLAAAIDRVKPIGASMSGALTAAGSQILRAAVPRLAAALHEWRRPGTLVLDDVQRLVDPTGLDALMVLFEHLPPGFRVALGARHAPDLSLDRLRATGRLLEIDSADLAFDDEETESLLAGVGQSVAHREAQMLVQRTEGWAAAIYLTTLDRRSRATIVPSVDSVSGRDAFIAGYLRTALEPGLGERDLSVLTRSSILAVIEPGVIEAVAGTPGAADRLRSLARENQLISRLGGSVEAYRLHHLLRDYLRQELERREPDAVPGLHRRAAAWFEEAGRPTLAIEHAFDSGDIAMAARLFASVAVHIHYQGQDDLLLRWVGRFDAADFDRYPGLAILAAWLYAFIGKAEAADRLAEIADRSTVEASMSDGAASFSSSRAVLNAILMRHGLDDALANALIAVAAEPPGSVFRMSALNELAAARMLKGETEAADRIWAEAAGSEAGGAVPYLPLACRAGLAIERGDWTAANRLAGQSHEALQRSGIGLIATTLMVHAVGARVAVQAGDLRRAEVELAHAQVVRPQASYALPCFTVWPLLVLARTYLAMADPAGARSVVSEAERVVRRRPELGVLNGQLADLRRQLDDAARTLSGPSTLTPAELRLLPLLSTYLSLEEIGERLSVTRSTAKAHALSVYAKLEVSGRSQAIDRAIQLGLLEPFPGLELGTGAG